MRADHLTHRALAGLGEGALRATDAKQPLLRVFDAVLHVEIDIEQVFVAGQHANPLRGVALHPGDFDDAHFLDRPRPLEIEPGAHGAMVFAEAQHHAARGFIDLLGGVEQRQQQHQRERDQDDSAGSAGATTGAAPAKQAPESFAQLLQGLFEIRGIAFFPGVALFFLSGLVPGHGSLVKLGIGAVTAGA